ncbi:MAG: glutamine synthetase III [Candidatus Cloacimonetes bacterium]|nr:glutamine synthetase III [Candidatus Cloacimonadota bacterium]
MKKTSDYFGELTFNKSVMRERLNKETYKKMIATIESGDPLDENIAPDVAHAMKEWAIQNGATHFTHWFQPQRGGTAEKHDAFISYDENGEIIERLSAKLLIQSEPDASSFPSGGMRSTFEARGYTAWDPTSPAFLLDSGRSKTLVIPSVFLSWTGDVLDIKTPFLRSQKALNDTVLKLQKLLGNRSAKRIKIFIGAEQEYFLVSKKFYDTRLDLQICGRTLFGASPEKGQQMSDHYFGSIRERVLDFMSELDHQLYRRGIPAKTRHNEVSPNQFEIVPLFEEANLAIDHNLQMMEIIKKVAEQFELVALLQEKPFAGLNGSGKHLNWSMGDNSCANYLEPSKSPTTNINFLMTIGAILFGVHKFGGLLRAGVADAGNDHRLGGQEAPPATMSIYLGNYLADLFNELESWEVISEKEIAQINLNIQKLPKVTKDISDRNRTSPIAFTGNKFEFRAVGSNQNCGQAAIIFNLLVAYGFEEIYNRLKTQKGNMKTQAYQVIKEILNETKDIRFQGNNYSSEWEKEAEKRKLPNAKNTPDALKYYLTNDSIKLFEKYKILNKKELESKISIKLENYSLVKLIEFKTAINMTNTLFIPVVVEYLGKLSETANSLKSLNMESTTLENEIKTLLTLYQDMKSIAINLKNDVKNAQKITDFTELSDCISSLSEPKLNKLRQVVDKAERIVENDLWPVAKYRELLAEL